MIADPQAVSLTSTVLPQMIALPQIIAWFHVSVSPPMVVQGDGVLVSHHWPLAVDVSIDFAEIDAALRIQRAGAFSEQVVLDAEVVVNADRGVLQDRLHGVRRQPRGGT